MSGYNMQAALLNHLKSAYKSTTSTPLNSTPTSRGASGARGSVPAFETPKVTSRKSCESPGAAKSAVFDDSDVDDNATAKPTGAVKRGRPDKFSKCNGRYASE